MRSLALLLSALSLTVPAQAATVLSVGDGDTITVREEGVKVHIRLACIDAPEMKQAPYGKASRDALKNMLPTGTKVGLKDVETDRYGRTVAEVLKGKYNINQEQVSSGNAFVYWRYIKGCDRNAYADLEERARSRKAGIWSEPGGIERPWEFRKEHKEHDFPFLSLSEKFTFPRG